MTDRQAYHAAAEQRVAHGRFDAPAPGPDPKDVAILAQTDLLVVAMQTLREGGENNLHYHVNGDQYYFVLQGRVRFFGPDDRLYAELGPREGVIIPAGARYRFCKIGDETVELLQSMGRDPTMDVRGRFNIEPHKPWMREGHLTQYEPPADPA